MENKWPPLSYPDAKETYQTLHLWTQIIGKVKLAHQPWINHSWHVTLSVTPTGLTTGDLPADNQHFQLSFDFTQHALQLSSSTGQTRSFQLQGLSVADFYAQVLRLLAETGIAVHINLLPNELEEAIPFTQDTVHATYNPAHAASLHQALLQCQRVFTQFRAAFIGKCSPVHFFWGGFDMAVSRFSGRTAPKHPGNVPHLPDWVAQEAYSHEVCSCGFWPGNEMMPFAAFYTYIYPEPEGFKTAAVSPEQASYNAALGEFILPYEAIQKAANPDATLLDFLHTTYAAAAECAHWDQSLVQPRLGERH